jgi:spermidine synthase
MSGAALPGPLAAVIVFLSSAAVLVLEILAGRLLAPYIGVTLETFTGIIGVVLAGIALGTWVGGRVADRVDPRRVLPHTLILGGATAIMAVPLIRWIGPGLAGSGPTGVVTLTTVGFLIPAALLSAASPLVVKIVLTDLALTGHVVGRLSAIGTAGSLVGVFVTGFVLIAAFPTTPVIIATGLAAVAGGCALWWGLGRSHRVLVAMGVVLAAVASGTAATATSPCQTETAYFCARVEADPNRIGGRTLYLDTLRHSYVDLEDPTHLQFNYIEVFADLAAAVESATVESATVESATVESATVESATNSPTLRALHIGGGGFTFPRYLDVTRPTSTNLVLEIDAALVDLAISQLGLVLSDRLRVKVGDARTALRALEASGVDLVIGDAFGGLAVPWHLTTREFVSEVQRVLQPSGLYAVNVIDRPPLRFVKAEVATLAAVFAHVAVVAPPSYLRGEMGGNFVVVASDTLINADAIRSLLQARGAGEAIMINPAEITQWVGGAQVLTDDHAPVDQLITIR